MAEHRHEESTQLQPLRTDADPSLLNRSIANLFDNEIAHLPPGCRIHVPVGARNGQAELTVEDNGPGFPSAVWGRVFERLVKGQHSTGHGLGLAFVDAAIQAHGGHVRITDGKHGGAVTIMSLPLAEVLSEKV